MDFYYNTMDYVYHSAIERQNRRRHDEALEREYNQEREKMKKLNAHIKNLEDDSRIKNVIFNKKATVVFWDDGTKTVVHCQPGDKYDAEKGLLACMAKKFYGGNGFNRALAKWCPESD